MSGGSAGTVITGTLLMGLLAFKATDLVKYLVASFRRDGRQDGLNGLITLVVGSGLGIGVAFLMANTAWSSEIQLGNQTLATLPGTSLVVLGLVLTSVASFLFDGKKAIDRTDSASTPKLLPAPERMRRQRVDKVLSPPPPPKVLVSSGSGGDGKREHVGAR